MPTTKTIGPGEIEAAIQRLATAIAERHRDRQTVYLLGIANGGLELTRRLAERLGTVAPRLKLRQGTIDISFHRDDIGRHPIPKEFAPTQIPGDVHDANVILVDDVLFSGRTVKAALDEIFDHGRPAKVELAVLVDRGGRRLPVAAEFIGLTLEPLPGEKVVVTLDAQNRKRDAIRVEAVRTTAA